MKEYFLKRPFDLILALFGIIISFPLWIAAAVLIWLADRGPVFYAQKRIGKNRKLFTIYKFRSMIKDAEKNTGVVLASQNDPRITRVGRFLRISAMDELPQLLSIFKGDMSFVGPRPERPELVEQFKQMIPEYEARFAVKPGLTGLAQVRGRYNTAVRYKLKYDLFYIRKRNFYLDLKLIILSFWNTLLGKWEYGEAKK